MTVRTRLCVAESVPKAISIEYVQLAFVTLALLEVQTVRTAPSSRSGRHSSWGGYCTRSACTVNVRIAAWVRNGPYLPRADRRCRGTGSSSLLGIMALPLPRPRDSSISCESPAWPLGYRPRCRSSAFVAGVISLPASQSRRRDAQSTRSPACYHQTRETSGVDISMTHAAPPGAMATARIRAPMSQRAASSGCPSLSRRTRAQASDQGGPLPLREQVTLIERRQWMLVI